jgi:hypothetical protein
MYPSGRSDALYAIVEISGMVYETIDALLLSV